MPGITETQHGIDCTPGVSFFYESFPLPNAIRHLFYSDEEVNRSGGSGDLNENLLFRFSCEVQLAEDSKPPPRPRAKSVRELGPDSKAFWIDSGGVRVWLLLCSVRRLLGCVCEHGGCACGKADRR